jgi:hypothetical protein
LIVGQATAHGHASDVAETGDAFIEGAIGATAGDDDFGENGLFGVEAKAGHLGIGAVAHDARPGEDGLDIFHEIDLLLGAGGFGLPINEAARGGTGQR